MTEDDLDMPGGEPEDPQEPESTDSPADAVAEEPADPASAGPLDETTDAVRTGNPQVDAVLDSLDDLDDLPVDDHVGVFERAHDELRRALDADPNT